MLERTHVPRRPCSTKSSDRVPTQLTVPTQVAQIIQANMGVTLSHLISIKLGLVCEYGTMADAE